ncbi:enhancer of mRNA-decapping protein 3 [Pseudohyphozyma bogoriensis]|nr:enhancer of mRNA-decapping protein 3 [Pseudohyphozyma bogoriensis]
MSQAKKPSMAELKLRRLTEHNMRLREDLDRQRVRVSEASASLIRYCKTTRDYLCPSVWGPVGKAEDPATPVESSQSRASRMASAFVSLPVLCRLHDGSSIEGTVVSIDAIQGLITLEPATHRPIGRQHFTVPSRTLNRTDVAGLELLSVVKSPGGRGSGSGTPRSASGVHSSQSSGLANQFRDQLDISSVEAQGDIYASSSPQPQVNSYEEDGSKPGENGAGKKRARRKGKKEVDAAGGLRQEEAVDPGNEADLGSWGEEGNDSGIRAPRESAPPPPAAGTFSEDFDFLASASRFDKAKVFAQIQSQDGTDPSSRLVAHNRIRKLGNSENVLTVEELEEQNRSHALPQGPGKAQAQAQVQSGAQWDQELEVKSKTKGRAGGPTTGFVTREGVKAVEVKLRAFKEVLSIAEIETGPTSSQRHENSSRCIASFILSLASPPTSLFPLIKKRPKVGVLVEDCDKGLVGLRTGVHLSNHGAQVVGVLLGASVRSGVAGEEWRNGLRVFSSAGGRIIRDLEDLSEDFDIIIDALSDNDLQSSLVVKTPTALSIATWASSRSIPILSIDSPFGVDHDTGLPTIPTPLKPRYVVSLGAVRKGLLGAWNAGAEVVLADIGIPPNVWSRVGVDEWEMGVWRGEFVKLLERV